MSSSVDVVVASADPGLAGQVALALGGERFDVETAGDTDQAVHRIAARPPDVVVLDLRLEGSGALALARTLRAQPETADVRALLILPAGEEAPEQAPGIDGVLAASFTSLALLRKVEAVVEGSDAG